MKRVQIYRQYERHEKIATNTNNIFGLITFIKKKNEHQNGPDVYNLRAN